MNNEFVGKSEAILFSVAQMITIGRSWGVLTPQEESIATTSLRYSLLHPDDGRGPDWKPDKESLEWQLAQEGIYFDRCREMIRDGHGGECQKILDELQTQKCLVAASA